MRRLYRVARTDFWIAVAAIVAVLSAGVLSGVIIGVALSLVWLVYINATPDVPLLGRVPGSQAFRSIDRHPDGETYPGLMVVRFDAGLFFASADALTDRLRQLAEDADPPYDTVVISFEGVDFIDSQGSSTVNEVLELAESYGAEIRLARVKPSVIDVLRRDEVIDALGEDHIYPNVYEAAADRIDG